MKCITQGSRFVQNETVTVLLMRAQTSSRPSHTLRTLSEMAPTISYRQLRKAALKYYALAVKSSTDLPAPNGYETLAEINSRERKAFFDKKLQRKLHERVYSCITVRTVKVPRVVDILWSAHQMQAKWTEEVARWDRYDEYPGMIPAKRVHEKGPISAFVRSYIQKPPEDLALDANWFVKKDDSDVEESDESSALSDIDSDTEEQKESKPKLPQVNQAAKDSAQEELRVVMACLPADVIDSALSYLHEKKLGYLADSLADYSEYIHERYRARRFIDQSNVLCKLSQWRSKEAPVIDFLATDSLQLIAEFAGAKMRQVADGLMKPLPVRMARLTQKDAISKAISDVLSTVNSRTPQATRASLKRIFDAIPPPPALVSPSPVALPAKKKAKSATKQAAAAADQANIDFDNFEDIF